MEALDQSTSVGGLAAADLMYINSENEMTTNAANANG